MLSNIKTVFNSISNSEYFKLFSSTHSSGKSHTHARSFKEMSRPSVKYLPDTLKIDDPFEPHPSLVWEIIKNSNMSDKCSKAINIFRCTELSTNIKEVKTETYYPFSTKSRERLQKPAQRIAPSNNMKKFKRENYSISFSRKNTGMFNKNAINTKLSNSVVDFKTGKNYSFTSERSNGMFRGKVQQAELSKDVKKIKANNKPISFKNNRMLCNNIRLYSNYSEDSESFQKTLRPNGQDQSGQLQDNPAKDIKTRNQGCSKNQEQFKTSENFSSYFNAFKTADKNNSSTLYRRLHSNSETKTTEIAPLNSQLKRKRFSDSNRCHKRLKLQTRENPDSKKNNIFRDLPHNMMREFRNNDDSRVAFNGFLSAKSNKLDTPKEHFDEAKLKNDMNTETSHLSMRFQTKTNEIGSLTKLHEYSEHKTETSDILKFESKTLLEKINVGVQVESGIETSNNMHKLNVSDDKNDLLNEDQVQKVNKALVKNCIDSNTNDMNYQKFPNNGGNLYYPESSCKEYVNTPYYSLDRETLLDENCSNEVFKHRSNNNNSTINNKQESGTHSESKNDKLSTNKPDLQKTTSSKYITNFAENNNCFVKPNQPSSNTFPNNRDILHLTIFPQLSQFYKRYDVTLTAINKTSNMNQNARKITTNYNESAPNAILPSLNPVEINATPSLNQADTNLIPSLNQTMFYDIPYLNKIANNNTTSSMIPTTSNATSSSAQIANNVTCKLNQTQSNVFFASSQTMSGALSSSNKATSNVTTNSTQTTVHVTSSSTQTCSSVVSPESTQIANNVISSSTQTTNSVTSSSTQTENNITSSSTQTTNNVTSISKQTVSNVKPVSTQAEFEHHILNTNNSDKFNETNKSETFQVRDESEDTTITIGNSSFDNNLDYLNIFTKQPENNPQSYLHVQDLQKCSPIENVMKPNRYKNDSNNISITSIQDTDFNIIWMADQSEMCIDGKCDHLSSSRQDDAMVDCFNSNSEVNECLNHDGVVNTLTKQPENNSQSYWQMQDLQKCSPIENFTKPMRYNNECNNISITSIQDAEFNIICIAKHSEIEPTKKGFNSSKQDEGLVDYSLSNGVYNKILSLDGVLNRSVRFDSPVNENMKYDGLVNLINECMKFSGLLNKRMKSDVLIFKNNIRGLIEGYGLIQVEHFGNSKYRIKIKRASATLNWIDILNKTNGSGVIKLTKNPNSLCEINDYAFEKIQQRHPLILTRPVRQSAQTKTTESTLIVSKPLNFKHKRSDTIETKGTEMLKKKKSQKSVTQSGGLSGSIGIIQSGKQKEISKTSASNKTTAFLRKPVHQSDLTKTSESTSNVSKPLNFKFKENDTIEKKETLMLNKKHLQKSVAQLGGLSESIGIIQSGKQNEINKTSAFLTKPARQSALTKTAKSTSIVNKPLNFKRKRSDTIEKKETPMLNQKHLRKSVAQSGGLSESIKTIQTRKQKEIHKTCAFLTKPVHQKALTKTAESTSNVNKPLNFKQKENYTIETKENLMLNKKHLQKSVAQSGGLSGSIGIIQSGKQNEINNASASNKTSTFPTKTVRQSTLAKTTESSSIVSKPLNFKRKRSDTIEKKETLMLNKKKLQKSIAQSGGLSESIGTIQSGKQNKMKCLTTGEEDVFHCNKTSASERNWTNEEKSSRKSLLLEFQKLYGNRRFPREAKSKAVLRIKNVVSSEKRK